LVCSLALGPALGSFLYSVGGFTVPFFVVGSVSLVISLCLWLVIPDADADISAKSADISAKSTDISGTKDVSSKPRVDFMNQFGSRVARWFISQAQNANLGKFWSVLQ
jgi:predicted MFS family arabinose efflux permease